MMVEHSSFLKRSDYFLITSVITLLVFPLQYVFRYLDDNRLTSWRWVFAGHEPGEIFLILVAGVLAAYLLSRYSRPERYPALSLIAVSYVSALFFWREPEVIIDASRYFTQAKHLEMYGIAYFIREWGGSIGAWTDLPLVPLLYGLIFKLGGESRILIQAFTTGLFSLTVLLTFLVGRLIWDASMGFTAGLLVLGIPYLYSQVPLMLVDVPAMFFLTFALFCALRALKEGGIWVAVAPPATCLALLSKYSTWLVLSVLFIVMPVSFMFLKQDRKRLCYRVLIILGIAAAIMLTFLIVKMDVVLEQIRLLREYQMPGLKRWEESFLSTFFFQVHPLVSIYAAYSVYRALRKKDPSYLLMLPLLLLVLVLQVRRARYLMILYPLLALMASYGMQSIRMPEVRRFLVYSVVVSSLVVSMVTYLPFLLEMGPVNLQKGGMFLDSLAADSAEVFTIPSDDPVINPAVTVPVLDIFTSKDLIYRYDGSIAPSFQLIEESPLRFTWGFRNPTYYSVAGHDGTRQMIRVVLSNRPGIELPDIIQKKLKNYTLVKSFVSTTHIFQYSPVMMIYESNRS